MVYMWRVEYFVFGCCGICSLWVFVVHIVLCVVYMSGVVCVHWDVRPICGVSVWSVFECVVLAAPLVNPSQLCPYQARREQAKPPLQDAMVQERSP